MQDALSSCTQSASDERKDFLFLLQLTFLSRHSPSIAFPPSAVLLVALLPRRCGVLDRNLLTSLPRVRTDHRDLDSSLSRFPHFSLSTLTDSKMEIDSPLTSLATSSPGSPSSPHSLPRSAPFPTPADIRPSPPPLQLDQTPAEHLATLDTHKQNPLATLGAETGGYEDELDYNDVADLYVGIGLSSEEDGEAETRVMDGFEELEEGELQGSSTTESTSEERDVAVRSLCHFLRPSSFVPLTRVSLMSSLRRRSGSGRGRIRRASKLSSRFVSFQLHFTSCSVQLTALLRLQSSASSVQQPSTATLASSSSIDAREVNVSRPFPLPSFLPYHPL